MIERMPIERETRAIVAENVRRLFGYDRRTGKSRVPQNVLAKKGVSQATVGRIFREEVDPRVDTVAMIARHFHLEPWHLLIEGMELEAMPKGREFSKRLRELLREFGIDPDAT